MSTHERNVSLRLSIYAASTGKPPLPTSQLEWTTLAANSVVGCEGANDSCGQTGPELCWKRIEMAYPAGLTVGRSESMCPGRRDHGKRTSRSWRGNMDLRLELRRTSKLVVASPKGDLVSVAFLSRHSRAGLWILPSLPGLVCGNDLWPDKTVRK
jgi:hypothetical protein